MPGNLGRPTKLDQVVRHRDDGTPVTVADHVVQAIGAGNYVEQAAASAGIHKTTVYDWLRQGARISTDIEQGRRRKPSARSKDGRLLAFSYAVDRAQAEWLVQQNTELERASRTRTVKVTTKRTKNTEDGPVIEVTTREHQEAPDTSVIRWRLERMHPKLYGPTGRLEVSGPDGGPIPMDVRTQALAALGEAAAQLAQNAQNAAAAQAAAEEAQETGHDGRPAGEPPAGPA